MNQGPAKETSEKWLAAASHSVAPFKPSEAATVAFAVVGWVALEFAMMTRLEWAERSRSMGIVSFSLVGFFVAHWAIVEFGRSVGVIRGQNRSKRGIE